MSNFIKEINSRGKMKQWGSGSVARAHQHSVSLCSSRGALSSVSATPLGTRQVDLELTNKYVWLAY